MRSAAFAAFTLKPFLPMSIYSVACTFGLKIPWVSRMKRLVLPTPLSPNKIVLNVMLVSVFFSTEACGDAFFSFLSVKFGEVGMVRGEFLT